MILWPNTEALDWALEILTNVGTHWKIVVPDTIFSDFLKVIMIHEYLIAITDQYPNMCHKARIYLNAERNYVRKTG